VPVALRLQEIVGLADVAPINNPRYTLSTHSSAENKKEDPMLYCEKFTFSRTFGDRTCSSVIRTVLR
jgi:hypothetical protein